MDIGVEFQGFRKFQLNAGNITQEETSIKEKWEKESSVQSLC